MKNRTVFLTVVEARKYTVKKPTTGKGLLAGHVMAEGRTREHVHERRGPNTSLFPQPHSLDNSINPLVRVDPIISSKSHLLTVL